MQISKNVFYKNLAKNILFCKILPFVSKSKIIYVQKINKNHPQNTNYFYNIQCRIFYLLARGCVLL